jgi:type IV pilus assembly protein PilB
MVFEQYLNRLLKNAGLLTQAQIERLLSARAPSDTRRVDRLAIAQGLFSAKDFEELVKQKLKMSYVEPDLLDISKKLNEVVPEEFARTHGIVPVSQNPEGTLLVAMCSPFDVVAIGDLKLIAKMAIEPCLADPAAIARATDRLYSRSAADKTLQDIQSGEGEFEKALGKLISSEEIDETANRGPIIDLVNTIIQGSVRDGASDIHFEPGSDELRVRIRINGSLHARHSIPLKLQNAVLARIKVMANLNIAEKRIPQDGRFETNFDGRNVDIRTSTLPSFYGEKAVLRLLDRSDFLKTKQQLGFTENNIRLFDDIIHNPHGIVLVCGPTGSGKSTTLYTVLNELNTVDKNIITIEDPVEFLMRGITQIQVNAKAGLSFAGGFRSILRQDPDIIMLGEIRDEETVEIACRAAITGHLVLSTIHTNDAVSTVYRLMDMGIPPYMVASALVGIISQRLIKILCPHCKQKYKPSAEEFHLIGIQPDEKLRFYKPVGCPFCSGTGYSGRRAVHEIFKIGRGERALISTNPTIDVLRDHAVATGMLPLPVGCRELLFAGETSVNEVAAVSFGQED